VRRGEGDAGAADDRPRAAAGASEPRPRPIVSPGRRRYSLRSQHLFLPALLEPLVTPIRTASPRALPWRGFGAAAAALVLAACSDRLPTQTPDPVPAGVSATRIECTVTVASGEMRCGLRAPGGPSPNLLLGGQGIYLRLVSSGTHYDGSAVFESSVLVQNLLDQPMGSADGTTVYGMNVLFASGPTVTSGTGTVTVANPDSTGTFTATGQPYFHYGEILAPRGSSQPKLWRFSVPPSVGTFAFTLLVETRLQNEPGILRWERKAGKASGFLAVYDVWGSSARNVYAVGPIGTIMHYDGSSWAVLQRPVKLNLYALSGSGPRSIYAVGEKGVIVHSDGNHWTVQQDSVVGRTLTGVAVPTPDTAYTVGWQREAGTTHDAGLLARTTDGGAHWTAALTADSLNTYISGVWALSPTDVYAAGYRYDKVLARYQGVILHSADAGASWATQVSAHTGDRVLFSLWAEGPGSVYAAGYQVDSAGRREALVLHSTDGGASWGASTAPHDGDRVIQQIWGTGDGVLFAVGQQDEDLLQGMVLRSTDGGATWTDVPGSYGGPVYSGWGLSSTDFYAVGSLVFMRWDGSAWSYPGMAAYAGGAFQASWTPDNTLVFAVGGEYNEARGVYEGLISRSTDGGATWTRTLFPGPIGMSLQGIWGTSANDVYVVGDDAGDGIILHSANGGDSWQEVPVPTADTRQLYSVWGSAANDVYVAGLQFNAVTGRYEALILHSTNGGATWAMTTHGSPVAHGRALTSIWGTSAAELYAVGWDYEYGANVVRGLTMRSTDGGASWASVVLDGAVAGRLSGVWAAPGAGAYAVGNRAIPGSPREEGVVLYSADGFSWSVVKSAQGGRNDFGYESVWGSGPGHVYAVGGVGTITRFDGTSWLDMASGSRDDLTGIFGTSSTSAWVVGQNGTVLRGAR
jgi:photosystem II stability/assembly factor-like uncharacterized protein